MLPVTVTMADKKEFDITYPTKTAYKPGEALDLTGFKVLQINPSGEKVDITNDVELAIWTREGINRIKVSDTFILQGTDNTGYDNYLIYIYYMSSGELTVLGSFFVDFKHPDPTPTPTPKIVYNGVELKPDGYPFLPGKDLSSALPRSGWKYFEAMDGSKLRILEDGYVATSSYFNKAFYFQDLGNNKYYIRDAYGGYLSYEGSAKYGAKIVISNKPCKWYITTEYWHPIVYYYISPDENHDLYIYSSGYYGEAGPDGGVNPAREKENSNVMLYGPNKSEPKVRFYIYSTSDSHMIPQWWFEMIEGKAAPSGDLRELDKGDEDEYLYYERQAFKEETKLPVTGTAINFNMELCSYDSDTISPYADTVINMILSKNERGTYISAEADGEYVYISKYSSSGEYRGMWPIKYELPKFGAIFSGEKYNYIAFGNRNLNESSGKEVIRIVKYDKEWNRISSASIYGGEALTRIPFDATSARFAEKGNQLILHTGRQRFKSSDGINHQSNLTIYINTDNMKVTSISGSSPANHVSHSFDAYVNFDGSTPVFLDHGDSYPRSVVLQKGSGSSFKKATMFAIKGPSGANWTGVSVGGLEISTQNYLTVVSATDQSTAKWGKSNSNAVKNAGMVPTNASSLGRDIIVCVLPKNFSNGASAKNITVGKYRNTKITPLEPQLWKINDNKFAVLWAEHSGKKDKNDYSSIVIDNYVVQYIDGNGNLLGNKKQYSDVNDFYKDFYKEVESQSKADEAPAVPGSLTVEKASATSVTCTWKAVSGAGGYEIYMATSENGTYEKVGSTTKELTYTIKSLKAGNQYYFKVRAYKTVNGKKKYGKYTSVISIKL